MAGRLFFSYRRVFEQAQSLWDSKAIDLNCSYEAFVQKEALAICHGMFASFLCVLSLSSVLGRFIQLCYPVNCMYKYKKLFSQLVGLTTEPLSGKPIIILWSKYFWVSYTTLLVICPQESIQLKLSTVTKTIFQQ